MDDAFEALDLAQEIEAAMRSGSVRCHYASGEWTQPQGESSMISLAIVNAYMETAGEDDIASVAEGVARLAKSWLERNGLAAPGTSIQISFMRLWEAGPLSATAGYASRCYWIGDAGDLTAVRPASA